MGSRRKHAKNNRTYLEFQLRSEGEALKRGTRRREKRLARKQIRKEDDVLASALSNVSVAESTTISTPTPTVGAPLMGRSADVNMVPRERIGRIRKPCKKCRERRAKYRMRKASRTAMVGIVPASISSSPSKSVRFDLEPKRSN